MRTDASEIFGRVIGHVLDKAGTSEGAIRGWETRRRGGPPIPPKGYFISAKAKVETLAQESADELKQEIENNRKRIPTDYMGMIHRDEARRQQGYDLVMEAADRLRGITPGEENRARVAWMLNFADNDAKRISQRDGETPEGEPSPWYREFENFLTEAAEISARAK